MDTILKHAQGLVYALLYLMPSSYQHASLSSLLGALLEPFGFKRFTPTAEERMPGFWMKISMGLASGTRKKLSGNT